MPDFSLLQTPNFAAAALSGYQAGAKMAKDQQLDAALGNIDLSRPESVLPVLRADPATGVALLNASQKMAEAQHDAASRHALAGLILGSRGGNVPATPARGSVPSLPAAAGTSAVASALTPNTPALPGATAGAATDPAAPVDTSGDVVVTGQRFAPPPAPAPQAPVWSDAETAAINADPEGFLRAQGGLQKMTEAHLAMLQDGAGAQFNVATEAQKLPYAQRRAFIQAQAPMLAQHGVTQAMIDQFDPTDENIALKRREAIGTLASLQQDDKDRTFAQTVHHQGVEEAQGQQRIGLEGQSVGISAGNLAVSRGNLAVSQHRETRETAAAAAKTVAGAPAARVEYRTVNGVLQKRVVQ